ncbi:Pdr15p [Saccharomyces cerevisiae x Saccharomyces kudriavzevii VIN7]|uniref:Pdr15p n=1 Tax=Saccharomyces cerevisiae x Saccharomyces kudriavzevii (strain VIN7) TaxID=1095631 RepID=H0GTB7_SACCK|nr:Pdr15p [Saccharomyces cerevisiae x Saccharomyces kudriavzevii VIN7]
MSVEKTDLESALCALWLLEELFWSALFELVECSKLCDVSVLANSCTLSAASLSKPRYGCCPMDWAAELGSELCETCSSTSLTSDDIGNFFQLLYLRCSYSMLRRAMVCLSSVRRKHSRTSKPLHTSTSSNLVPAKHSFLYISLSCIFSLFDPYY